MALFILQLTVIVTLLMAMEGSTGYGASMKAQLLMTVTKSGTFLVTQQEKSKDKVKQSKTYNL